MMEMIFGMVSRRNGWSVENEECKVWVSMRVLEGWKGGEGMFKCG